MRNSSFFQKLTGSLRLSDEDINALSDTDNRTENKKQPATVPTKKGANENVEIEEIIEEVDDEDFEIPEDAEVETIEEIIEDDSIDHEEVEEYYEEIIDEEEPEDVEIQEEEEIDEDDEFENDADYEEDAEDDIEEHSVYGNNHQGEYDDEVEISNTHDKDYPVFKVKNNKNNIIDNEDMTDEEEQEESNLKVTHHEEKEADAHELPVDVFEMHNEVIVRILVPGITPENLKVSITRNHVSLACSRPAPDGIKDSSYFEREIPYGVFNRMIQLPSDVDVEHAEAVEKYGLLIIRLPKVDVKKVQELKIKSV